jgi:hypothetical protein
VKARKIRRGEDEDAFDREFWQAASPNEKFAASWELTRLWAALHHVDESELRLDRTVARIERRKR